MIETLTNSVQSGMFELDEKHHKKFSVRAKNILLNHDWPGNVRELQNTIARAVLWSDGTIISEDDTRDAILATHRGAAQDLLALPLEDGFSLQELLEKIEQHYILRALAEAHIRPVNCWIILRLKAMEYGLVISSSRSQKWKIH